MPCEGEGGASGGSGREAEGAAEEGTEAKEKAPSGPPALPPRPPPRPRTSPERVGSAERRLASGGGAGGGPPLLSGVSSAFGGHYRVQGGGPFEVGGGLLGGGLVVGPATPLALLGVAEPLPRRGGSVSPCCHLRKYVVLCLGVGALSSLIGSLFLLVHLLLRARTSSLHYFETVPAYVPASVLILTGLVVACFARRKNRYGYLMKVSGGCWLGCAALCVAVTVTTTVLHMNRLQTLRECVYTQRIRTCVCYSHPHVRHPGPPLPPPPTSTAYTEDGSEHRFVFGDTSDCEVVHGALYWCLRALFGLSVAALLLCIFAAMLVYQLLHHERKKTYWEQLEMRCRHLYPSVRESATSRGVPPAREDPSSPTIAAAPDPSASPPPPSPPTLREASPVTPVLQPIPPSPPLTSHCGCHNEECRECAEERNCCPQARPSPRPHPASHGSHSRRTGQDVRPWHAWESMDDRYWSSRVGNLYSPNPEEAVGQRDGEGVSNERSGQSQRWNWRLPWNRSMPGGGADDPTMSDAAGGGERPSHQFSPDSQYGFGGGNEPCHGSIKTSQTVHELRPPSPPLASSARPSASPVGRPHCPRSRASNRPALVPSLSADAVALGVSALDDLHLSNVPPYTYLWGPPPPYPQSASRLELRGLRGNSESGRRHSHHRHPHKHLHRHHHHHHREKPPLEEDERWQGEGTCLRGDDICEEGEESQDCPPHPRMSLRGRHEPREHMPEGEWEPKRQQRHGNVESELYFADVSSCNGGREERQQYGSADEDDGRGTSEDGETGRATTTGEGSTDDGDLSSSGYYGGGGGAASSPLVPSPSEAFLRGGPIPNSDSECHKGGNGTRDDGFRFGHPTGHIAPDARYEMPRRGPLRRQCAYVREEPDGDGMDEDEIPVRHSGSLCQHRRQCPWPRSRDLGSAVPDDCCIGAGEGITTAERSAFRPFPRSFSEEDAVAMRMASVDV